MDLRVRFYKIATGIYKDIDYPDPPIPIYMMFYVLMSQYLKNIKIMFSGEKRSLRLSFFFISPSRTGKGQLLKVVEMIAEKLNLKCITDTIITDAGMIGQIDEKAIEFNYKHKLDEEDPEYKNPVVYGDIFNYDIILFKECKVLLERGKHTPLLLSILQEALDEPGYVRKKLGSKYSIEGSTSISLIGTTYYMKEIENTLMEQGFFMRVPLYCKVLSIEQTKQLRDEVINCYGLTKFNMEKEIDELIIDIKKIDNKEKCLRVDLQALPLLKNLNNTYYNMMKEVTGIKLEILKSISQTVIDLAVKIGGIHACIEGSNLIKTEHIRLGIETIKGCADSIMKRIEIKEDKDKINEIKLIITAYKQYKIENNKNPNKEEFIEYYKARHVVGRNKILSIINRMKEENYFKVEKGDKNVQYLVLNEVWKWKLKILEI